MPFFRSATAQTLLLIVLLTAALALPGCAPTPATPAAPPAAPDAGGANASADSHFAEYAGQRVHYIDVGPRAAEAVVFLHGWSGDLTVWWTQVAMFATRYRVIAVDLIGHGQSDRPRAAYTLDFLAGSAAAALDDARLTQTVVVGHSLGATVARQLARSRPDLVRALVNVDGAFVRMPSDPEGQAAVGAEFDAFAAALRGPERDEAVADFGESFFTPDTPPGVRDGIMEKLFAADPYVQASVMEELGRASAWDDTPLPVPTLCVYAASEDLPEDNAAYMATLFPYLDYEEWEGVGHFLMLEAPIAFNVRLARFLSELTLYVEKMRPDPAGNA